MQKFTLLKQTTRFKKTESNDTTNNLNSDHDNINKAVRENQKQSVNRNSIISADKKNNISVNVQDDITINSFFKKSLLRESVLKEHIKLERLFTTMASYNYDAGGRTTLAEMCYYCRASKCVLDELEAKLKFIENETNKIYELLKNEKGTERNWIFSRLPSFTNSFTSDKDGGNDIFQKLAEIKHGIEKMEKTCNEQKKSLQQKQKDLEGLKEENNSLYKLVRSQSTRISNLNDELQTNKEHLKNRTRELKDSDANIVILMNNLKKSKDEYNRLKNDKKCEEEKYRKEILSTEQQINYKNRELKETKKNLEERCSEIESLQKILKELKKLINNNETELTKEKEKLQNKLSEMLKFTEKTKTKVSLKDIELEIENQFITETNKLINEKNSEAKDYEKQINAFIGDRESKQYLHIREMLMRILESLDGIESQNNEAIKSRIKESIGYIKSLQRKLNDKAKSNVK